MKELYTFLVVAGVTASTIAAEPTPPDKYEVLIGEGLEGSGFVIRYGDKFFGVASLHQFGGKTPSTLEPIEGDPIRLDKTRAFKQRDVQVLPVLAPSSKLQFLNYSPDFSLRAGEEVIILGPGGDVVTGTLTTKGMTAGSYKSADGPRNLEVRASKPLMMAGGSGGPLIKKETGYVVGVLITADDAMEARKVGFETLCLTAFSSKSEDSSPSDPAAEQLAKVFPSIYWYVADACIRETGRHGNGFSQKHDEFVKENIAVIEKTEELKTGAGKQLKIRLRLYDPVEPDEYWMVDLLRDIDTWKPIAGYKYINGKLEFDLMKDETLLGTKILGSMKPYFEKALAAYSQGKNFRTVFVVTKFGPANNVATNPIAAQLVGSWRHVDNKRRLTTNYTFRQDGTFFGSVVQSNRVTRAFTGKWVLDVGTLSYYYTGSSGVHIPVGTKNHDRVITISRDHYVIENWFGVHDTYVRIK